LIKIACRNLRKNMTKAEILLWENLKNDNIWKKVYRQKPIFVFKEDYWLDRYIIADFYVPIDKLVIEIDWNIHDLKEIYNLDIEKEKLLRNRWFKIIRFRNEQIINELENIINTIKNTI
jgi:very-short-patch-repair endonuclease